MIRILTSLVAVLTVTSIQPQTSLSQLSKILSEEHIDVFSSTYIDEIFKQSLSQHYTTKLYNGGFITPQTSVINDWDLFSIKDSSSFYLKKDHSKNCILSNEINEFEYYILDNFKLKRNRQNIIESFTVLLNSNLKGSVIFDESLNLFNKTHDDTNLKYSIIGYFNTKESTHPLLFIQNDEFCIGSHPNINNVLSVQRIRSPNNSIFFL